MNIQENLRQKMQRKTNLRNFVRIFGGIVSGIFAGAYSSWSVLFILIISYCLFEMVIVFSLSRRSYLVQNGYVANADFLPREERKRISNDSGKLAFQYAAIKFIRSFILMGVIGLTVMFIVEALLSF